MSQTAQTPDNTASAQPGPFQEVTPTAATAWVGWIAFAACMMVMLGAFHAMAGLVALLRDEYFLVGSNGLVISVDYTTWGWLHLLGGIAVTGAGAALFAGRMWARTAAVVLSVTSAVANVAFLAAYPIWSTIMIAVAVLVIWAVIVHGSEMQE